MVRSFGILESLHTNIFKNDYLILHVLPKRCYENTAQHTGQQRAIKQGTEETGCKSVNNLYLAPTMCQVPVRGEQTDMAVLSWSVYFLVLILDMLEQSHLQHLDSSDSVQSRLP